MHRGPEDEVEKAYRAADYALRRGRARREVEALLDELISIAPVGSEESLFAHRHLAEFWIEDNPWKAAVYLREVLKFRSDDDVVQALSGLCHAMLGNFRMASTAYRRALAVAPRNPWYHHNLGHLLDVALGAPQSALPHLEIAHDIEPLEDEITASYAHCLATLGRVDEAQVLANEACQAAPDNAEHVTLLNWIKRGAPNDATRPSSESPRPGALHNEETATKSVEQALERGLQEAGFSPPQVDCARALWADFRDGRRIRVMKPEVYAAAVEYAIALVHGIDGVTQASIARRYGIAQGTLSLRYGEIREALHLRPRDPRYDRI